jgi:hypothetical protein
VLIFTKFAAYSYADDMTKIPDITTDYTRSTTEAVPTTPTMEGQVKKLWAMGAIDLYRMTTPDYNRLVLQQAFGNMFE